MKEKNLKKPSIKKKSFTKVSKGILNEIRKRYEYGESLKELAYEYRVNYGTLKNYSSKEKWQKGIIAGVIYLKEVEEDIERYLEQVQQLKNAYKGIHKSNLSHLISLEKNGHTPRDMKIEIALKTRIEAIAKSYEFAKELYGIRNQDEEIEYKKKMAEYEKYKRELLGDENKGTQEESSDIQEARNMLLRAKGVKR